VRRPRPAARGELSCCDQQEPTAPARLSPSNCQALTRLTRLTGFGIRRGPIMVPGCPHQITTLPVVTSPVPPCGPECATRRSPVADGPLPIAHRRSRPSPLGRAGDECPLLPRRGYHMGPAERNEKNRRGQCLLTTDNHPLDPHDGTTEAKLGGGGGREAGGGGSVFGPVVRGLGARGCARVCLLLRPSLQGYARSRPCAHARVRAPKPACAPEGRARPRPHHRGSAHARGENPHLHGCA
jgi:hypothetical protein